MSPEYLRKVAGQDATTPVEEGKVADFFRVAAGEQDWKGEAELALAKRYQALVSLLEANLTGLKIYRVGETNIAVYIVDQK